LAGFSVINSVAVAQIQAVGRAKAPDRVLHEAREFPGNLGLQTVRISVGVVCVIQEGSKRGSQPCGLLSRRGP